MLFSRSLSCPRCSTPPSNIQPSHTLPGPAHFHTLRECRCKELLKRSLSSPLVSCILLSSLSTFLPSFKTLLCQEASQKLVAAVRLFCYPPSLSPISQHFPGVFAVESQIAPTTVVSSSMAGLPKCTVVIATLSCFSAHTDKSFPCRTGTEVVAADRC